MMTADDRYQQAGRLRPRQQGRGRRHANGDGKPGVAHTVADRQGARRGQGGRSPTPSSSTTSEIDIREGETIFRAGAPPRHQAAASVLLAEARLSADGNCRVCMVEIEGERVLAASCIRTPTPGMKVKTQTDRAKTARKHGLRTADHRSARPSSARARSGFRVLEDRQRARSIEAGRFPKREPIEVPAPDRSHVAMAVNLDACIQCNLCVRACREVQVNDVIGMAGRGHQRKDRVRLRRSDGRLDLRRLRRMRAGLPDRRADAGDDGRREQRLSRQARPQGGLASARIAASAASSPTRSRTTRSSRSTARTARPTQNRLCVKGRFGFDYVANPQRLMKPMIRKDGVPKVPHEFIDPSNPWTHFREATWEEALDRAAGGLKKIRDRDGPDALAGFGSAKGSNEEAYLFQKLVRTGFGTNNVDHCTRLCHASSVSALLEGVGSAAVTATFNEVQELRRHHRHRRQPDREPSGRRDLLQAGGQARRQARHHGSARHGDEAPRLEDDAVQERHRRRDAQRHAQRHRRRRSSTTSNTSRPTSKASTPGRRTSRTSRRRRWRRSAASRPTRCARSRAPTRAPKARSSSGAWASRSTPTAPTMRAA